MSTLAICPLYMTDPQDTEIVFQMARSLRATEPDLELLLVDDGSPIQGLVDEVESRASDYGYEVCRQPSNEGFSRTVNVGLQRALDNGQNALLVNADVEFIDPGWLRHMVEQTTPDGEGLAGIVGALLLYPSGLIQHAGIFFSLLHRHFGHIYQFAPADLPEAQLARRCPVTAALQFIRHDVLEELGLYDENFRLGFEDVDYCIRAWLSGRDVVMQPRVRAYHYESLFRGRLSDKVRRWQGESWLYFMHKYRSQSFAEFVPSVL